MPNKNPWSKLEPSDGLSVDLYNSEGDPTIGNKKKFMGPPTEQEMVDQLWKDEIMRQYLLGDPNQFMSHGRLRPSAG